MDQSLLKAISVVLAVSFSTLVLLLVRRCFPGWASDAAIGRGAGLSLASLVIAIVLAVVLTGVCALAVPVEYRVWAQAYVTAGFAEETARYIALLLLLRGMVTDDPREFVAGCAAVGLGFGVIENLGYLAGNDGKLYGHVELGAIRGIVSAPGHLAWAFLSGFGIWSVARRGKPMSFAVATYLLAVFLHGTFDVALMLWPEPESSRYADVGALQLASLAVVIVIATASDAVVTLFVMGEFIAWTWETEPHDPRAHTGLAVYWPIIGTSLAIVAVLLIAAPAMIGVAGNWNKSLFYAPILFGAAASMTLWSIVIRRLADS